MNRLRLLLLVGLFGFVLQPLQATPVSKTDSMLSGTWYELELPSEMEATLGKRISFDSEAHTYQTFDKNTLLFEGNWAIRNDSLLLYNDYFERHEYIDSIVYMAKGSTNEIIYYKGGQEVAHHGISGLSSPRNYVGFSLATDSLSKKKLVLALGGQVATLGPTIKSKKDGFGFMDIVRGLLGLAFFIFVCWLLSTNRKAIDWRLVGAGVGLQLFFAFLVLKVPGVSAVFRAIAGGFVEILGFTTAGTKFLFGPELGAADGPLGFGVIFAFQVLPIIVFFSSITSLLYYLGILQRVVYGFAWVMAKTMRLSGAESLAAAGNIFLGQTEAPLLVKPYLEKMTRSEILCLMGGGMATIAGSVFGAYVSFLGGGSVEQQTLFATHLLTASIMAAPGAIVAAKILLPETEKVNTDMDVPRDKIGSNVLDAIANGASEGMRLAVNVGIMLLVFIAFVQGFNWFLGDIIGYYTGLNGWVADITDGKYSAFDLKFIFGALFAPVAWLLGTPSEDMMIIGQLLGEKTIINEFVAFDSMAKVKDAGSIAHFKSIIIATYALCGFANISSIGIQIGGIGSLAPGQRKVLSQLGVRALIVGTVAAFFAASIAGMLAEL